MGTRYVEIPADRLRDELSEVGASVEARGGRHGYSVQGREVVWDLALPGRPGVVRAIRVYTSLAVGDETLRACDTDAVRIVVGHRTTEGFKPLEKGRKVLRTAPKNVDDRVGVFLERLRGVLREAYARAVKIQACPDCHRPMARRKSKHGEFLGCTGYPECRTTARVAS